MSAEPECDAVRCRDCGAESVVWYSLFDLATGERSEYGRCAEHAPTCSPEEFFRL